MDTEAEQVLTLQEMVLKLADLRHRANQLKKKIEIRAVMIRAADPGAELPSGVYVSNTDGKITAGVADNLTDIYKKIT
jgi:hypothetical protein